MSAEEALQAMLAQHPSLFQTVEQAAPALAGSNSMKSEAGKGGTAGDGAKPARKTSKRTSLDRVPGRRPMKEYPVTGEELFTLGIMQGGAAIMLAFSGACFGFYVSTKETIALSGLKVRRIIRATDHG